MSPARLSDRSVALIIKAAAARAGLDAGAFAEHSLRDGVSAARLNAEAQMKQLRPVEPTHARL